MGVKYSAMTSFEGSEPSMFDESWCRGDLLHSVFHHFFASPLSFCLVAAMLSGSSLCRTQAGSFARALNPTVTASFASLSAILFPSIFSCPGVHTNLTLQRHLRFHSLQPVVPLSSFVRPFPSWYPGINFPLFLASITCRSSRASCTLSSR